MKYEKYKSSTIILQEQSHEFAVRKSMPVRGEARLETGNGKAAVRVIVQNLTPPDKCGRGFILCFFGRSGDATIHAKLGNVVLNRFGNGETYFRFDPCNVDGNGHELADFLYIVIAAAPHRSACDSLKSVLTGMLSPHATLQASIQPTPQDPEQVSVHPASQDVSQASAQPAPQDSAQASAEIDNVCGDSTPAQEASDLHREGDIKHHQDTIGDTIENVRETEESQTEPVKSVQGSPATYNCYYNRLIMQKCEKLHMVMRKNRDLWQNRVQPFEDDKLGAEWYKVDNYRLLPLISHGAEDACMRYKHFIFGYVDTRYYIGVPGRFTKEEQPESGQSGFTYWQPIDAPAEHSYGYWITAINTETGDIIDAASQK